MSFERTDTLTNLLAALTAAGDVAYEWDLGSDLIAWTGPAAELFRITDVKAISHGRLFSQRISGEDLIIRQERLDSHFGDGGPYECEYRIVVPGGTTAWVQDRGGVERDAAGRPFRFFGILRPITNRKAQEQKLQQLANFDELTGHFNKTRLREALDHVVAYSQRTGTCGAYLAVGIDKLTSVNEAFGYEAADAVIIEVGRRLDRCLRFSDTIGRVSGDRFGIVLGSCPEANVHTAAEKILAAISRVPIPTAGGPVYVTVSIGGATFPEQAKTAYEVMARAESALAEAKRAGRDCFSLYHASEETRRQQRVGMALGDRVQRALKQDRLVFAFQPVVGSTGAVDYYECLLRMIGEDGRVISAGEFVPAIEQFGFIRLIDRYVLERAIAEAAAHPTVTLGFNISGLTATDRSWLRAVVALLRDRPEVARRLVVEITETAALYDIDESARFVETLRELGCRVALDDFGAGFTSLRHLQKLAVDTVKIDGSFVRNLAESHDNLVFLRHLAGLANGFGLTTVAECVETAHEAAILRAEGIQYLQGYYFGRPSLERVWLTEPATSLAGTALIA